MVTIVIMTGDSYVKTFIQTTIYTFVVVRFSLDCFPVVFFHDDDNSIL